MKVTDLGRDAEGIGARARIRHDSGHTRPIMKRAAQRHLSNTCGFMEEQASRSSLFSHTGISSYNRVD